MEAEREVAGILEPWPGKSPNLDQDPATSQPDSQARAQPRSREPRPDLEKQQGGWAKIIKFPIMSKIMCSIA